MPKTQTQSSFNFLQDGDTPARFPQRGETMSLSTLGSEAKNRNTQKLQRATALYDTLRTDDIAGAQPTKQRFTHKGPPDDIEGSHPRKQTLVAKPSKSLDTSDIDGAKSRPFTFATSRLTDPLNPTYDMPVVEVKPPTPPPQLHRTLDISDVDGARAPRQVERPPRDIMNANDIEGAQADWKPQYKRALKTRDIMAADDINLKDSRRSKRVTNPLDPQYEFKDEATGKAVTYGQVDGATPKTVRPRTDGAQLSLTTDDIEGAHAGTTLQRPHQAQAKGQIKNTNYVGDIAGARPKTRFQQGAGSDASTGGARVETPRCFRQAKAHLGDYGSSDTGSGSGSGSGGGVSAGGRATGREGGGWWPEDGIDQNNTGYLTNVGDAGQEQRAAVAAAAPRSRPPRAPASERPVAAANASEPPAVIMPVQKPPSFRSGPPSSHGSSKPPSSHGKPPSSHGKPPSSHGKPPSSHGKPPSSHGKPPSSHGKPPSSHGKPPSSHGSRPPSSSHRRDALSSRGSSVAEGHGSNVRTPSGLSIPITRTRREIDEPVVTESGAQVLTVG